MEDVFGLSLGRVSRSRSKVTGQGHHGQKWALRRISREPLNGFAPNSYGRRVWSFARTILNVKVKSQWSRSTRTKNAYSQHPPASTEWNALAANNVTPAADATITSLSRGDFAGLRALGLAGYRCRALPGISSCAQ